MLGNHAVAMVTYQEGRVGRGDGAVRFDEGSLEFGQLFSAGWSNAIVLGDRPTFT